MAQLTYFNVGRTDGIGENPLLLFGNEWHKNIYMFPYQGISALVGFRQECATMSQVTGEH